MKYSLLKSLLITCALTMVFTNCFCQDDDPWISNKIHKDLIFKGRVDSCVYTGAYLSYKGDIAKRQKSYKEVDYYDKLGNIIKKYNYIFRDNVDTATAMKNPFITVYNYATNGNIAEIIYYKVDKIYAKDVFTYINGKTIENFKHYTLPDNKVVNVKKIKLNTKDEIEEEVRYNDSVYSAKPYWKINFEYNPNGYLVKDSTSYSHTTRTNQNFYTYDQNNNMIQKRTPATCGPVWHDCILVWDYTYPKLDKMHNWLEQDEFRDGKLTFVSERQITYHK